MKTLLLIDGNALIHRAYHALPEFETKNGTPTNAVYGFATILDKTISGFKPTFVAVCFDTKAPTFRKKMFDDYKIQRPKVEDKLIAQFPLVREMLTAGKIQWFEVDGYEADDIIATIATKSENDDLKILILTGDKDLMQIINNNINLITPQLGYSESKLYDTEAAIKRFGIKPELIPDFKALAGDQSDNYKGVDGIGPKTAANLINQLGTLEEIYENLDKVENIRIKELLTKYKEQAFFSKKLSLLIKDVKFDFDLNNCLFETYHEDLKNFFEKMEFKSLGKRFFPEKKIETQKIEKKSVDNQKKEQLGLF